MTGLIGVYAASASAVQPLTDSAMESVSAELSQNVLNVLGSPAAGLTEDSDAQLEISQKKVSSLDDGASVVATDILEDSDGSTTESQEILVDIGNSASFADIEEALSSSVSVTRTANQDESLFGTSSEVSYQKSSYKKDIEVIDPFTVRQTRDMTIDLIALENLKGGFDDDDEIAGSIYLSNFETKGVTTLIERQ